MPAPSMTTGDAGGTIGGDTVKTVFNLAALHAYRAANVHRAFADIEWDRTDGPMPGNVVTFTLISALAPATSALNESTEPSPVNMADAQKSITLVEYGNAVKSTRKLRLTSFLNLDLEVPREITANMEESVDLVARDVAVAGTNVRYGTTTSRAGRTSVAAGDNMTANTVRLIRAKLAGFNTPPPEGSPMYGAVIHPDVSYDLQAESGQQAWSAPHVYADPEAIYTGEIGALSGVRFIENANAKLVADASNGAGAGGTIDVYPTQFFGQQYLGEAVGDPQHVVISGPFDDLQRFISVGWYGLLGYGRIRENSGYRVEAASSIGANT